MQDAYRRCMEVASRHYENFPVLSKLMPRRLRPHIAAVYAFARAADDDADERAPADGRACLAAKRERILAGRYDGDLVFEALGETIREFNLPQEPFLDLLSAFSQDTEKNRYETFDEVLDYCSRSANPVGRLVLMLFGLRDPERFDLSDRICTALQLVNFWQDVAVDLRDRDRIYIPREDMTRFGVSEKDLAGPAYRDLMAFEVDRTEKIMKAGCALVGRLPFRLKWPVGLFAAGGWTILRRLRSTQLNGFRPTLTDWPSRCMMPVQFLKVMACRG